MGLRGRKPQYPNVVREIHLSDDQFGYVTDLHKVSGVPVSVVIRELVDHAMRVSIAGGYVTATKHAKKARKAEKKEAVKNDD
jgi:hypothetical protein